MSESLLVEGRSCWRRVRADRASFLVDAEAYYSALAQAFERAERSIHLLGWDFDTRVRIRSDGTEPSRLGPMLRAAVDRNPALEVRILAWDFALIYAAERQPVPMLYVGPLRHPRIHFRFDPKVPPGASHHQKVAVIDDRLGFSGGIDLTGHRWDRREHLPHDPLRTNVMGKPYGPYHDMQMAVSGEAGRGLGDLFRERWRRAIGEDLPAPSTGGLAWVDGLKPDVKDVEVGISRSFPPLESWPEVREIEALYQAMIGRARRWLYIENQYITSAAIGDALEARLEEAGGPEIVAVLPRDSSGWLEQATMDVLRTRLFRRLRAADHEGRFRLYYPAVTPESEEVPVYVHAKTAVADDDVVHIGSANLSNRSMGFDTECGITVEALDRQDVREAIVGYRSGLMAEHLGVSAEQVRATLAETGSLIATVEKLRGGDRSLRPAHREVDEVMLEAIPDRELIDPERPIDVDQWVQDYVPHADRRNIGFRALGRSVAPTLLLAAVLGGGVSPDLLDRIAGFAQSVSPVLFVALVFLAGTPLLVSVGALTMLAALGAGPLTTVILAPLGWALSNGLAYALGRRLDREQLRRLPADLIHRVGKRLTRIGFRAVLMTRLLPLAPSGVVSLLSGAARVRLGDFFVGGVLGTLPFVVGGAAFAHFIEDAVRTPTDGSRLALVLAWGVVVGAIALQGWTFLRGNRR